MQVSCFAVWFGVLFIRRGIYMGAVLRFTLTLPQEFGMSAELPVINVCSWLLFFKK